jgi:hypothetical protein
LGLDVFMTLCVLGSIYYVIRNCLSFGFTLCVIKWFVSVSVTAHKIFAFKMTMTVLRWWISKFSVIKMKAWIITYHPYSYCYCTTRCLTVINTIRQPKEENSGKREKAKVLHIATTLQISNFLKKIRKQTSTDFAQPEYLSHPCWIVCFGTEIPVPLQEETLEKGGVLLSSKHSDVPHAEFKSFSGHWL